MCFSRITTQADVAEYARSYNSHHELMKGLQLIVPVVGIAFGAGILLHDLKAYAVNKIFVDSALQGKFASSTYSQVKEENGEEVNKSRYDRVFSAINILSGGILVLINWLVLAIHLCCSGSDRTSGQEPIA